MKNTTITATETELASASASASASLSQESAHDKFIAAPLANACTVAKADCSKPGACSTSRASPTTNAPQNLASQLFSDDSEEASPQQESEISAANTTSHDAQASHSRKRRRAGSNCSHLESPPGSASLTAVLEPEQAGNTASDTLSLQLRIRQLELQLAEAKKQAQQSANVASAQSTVLLEMHSLCICHICLEPSFRPCVLAPCGHVFCIHCLRTWFTKLMPDEAPVPSSWSRDEIEQYERARTLKRAKLCPSCRTELACPPVEVYLVRDMLEKVDHALELSKSIQLDAHLGESSTAMLSDDDKARLKGQDLPKGDKLWADIFDPDGPRRVIYDQMDGVLRCGKCACEIVEGVCDNIECAIDYCDLEDEWMAQRNVDDVDSEQDAYDDTGATRAERNAALGVHLANFEARGVGAGFGQRVAFSSVELDDSSDQENMMSAGSLEPSRSGGARRSAYVYSHEDSEDDAEMDDFIVRDQDHLDYFDASASASEHEHEPWYERDWDDMDGEEGNDEEDDDFLPGPRALRGESAISISDDQDNGDGLSDTDSSVEYRGLRGASRLVRDDEDASSHGSRAHSETHSVQSVHEQVHATKPSGALGSSTDSSARRRRVRILDDDDE